MYKVNEDLSIYITRGDAANFTFTAIANDGNDDTGSGDEENRYQFRAGDTVRFKVFEKKDCANVVLCKDYFVNEPTYEVDIQLSGNDTKFGEEISKPKDYWYEIELNPESVPQTVVGYDEDGPKVLRLYPEGGDME